MMAPLMKASARSLQRQKYSDAFVADHLLPMGAAIWSCTSGMMLDFPVRSYMRFSGKSQAAQFC